MSKGYVSTGGVLLEDNCDVIPVLNYSTTAIADQSVLVDDATNMDTTQSGYAVTTLASADSVRVCGIAKGTIPGATVQGNVTIPGIGSMVVSGLTKVKMVSATYAVGDYIGTSTTAGAGAKGTQAVGTSIGYVAIAGTTVTSVWAWIGKS